ncbi:MAG: hypothetical protein IGQ88_13000, partial [Gloeomargaritaceae cyanobacterium C42_A2020_066]|nr:hypothetical protein [Gloeomargaritaceae cyanobacterium C42_A2020_066]
ALSGDAGDDSLSGGDRNDVLDGGTGFDILLGGEGADILRGGDDDDTLSGKEGNDTLQGDAGNDSLEGQAGLDNLSGGEGADTLIGSSGSQTNEIDTLTGGNGADFFAVDSRGANYVGGGNQNYALITDYNLAAGDRILVNADDLFDDPLTPENENLYEFAAGVTINGVTGVAISKRPDATAAPGTGDLIALVQGGVLLQVVAGIVGEAPS